MSSKGAQRSWVMYAVLAGAIGWVVAAYTSCGRTEPRGTPAAEAREEEKRELTASGAEAIRLDAVAQRDAGLTVEPVRLQKVQQAFRTTGTVAANETRLAHIRPLAGGRVEEVYVRLGDRVKAGQPLLAFDNVELGELIGRYGSALAALDRAGTESDLSRRAAERAGNLVNLGAVAKSEAERRQAEYRNALAAVESQKADVASIEVKLHRFGLGDPELSKLRQSEYRAVASRAVVRSPFGGVIIRYKVAEGEVIRPEDELFLLADLSTVWVLANIYEKDLGLVRQGSPVSISTGSYPGRTFPGRITYISDFLDPATRTVTVRCEVRNLEGLLKLDMFADVEIVTSDRRDAVVVPEAAVQWIQGHAVVFTRTGHGQFEKREVKVGRRNDAGIEIAEGLRPGEEIVTRGAFTLKSQLLKSQIGGEEEEGHKR